MNKKFTVIIILAILLALVVSLVMSNNEPRKPRLLKEDAQTEVIEEINIKLDNQPVLAPIDKDEAKRDMDEIRKSVRRTQKSPSSQAPAVKKTAEPQIKVEHVKEAVNAVSEPKEENIKEISSVQDEVSDDVVITTEYKFKSPSKYSFK